MAAELLTETKRHGRLRARLDSGCAAPTQRPRLPGEAPRTGAAQRSPVLEPGGFLYAYRRGHTARCRDATRSLKNRMETITSVPQTGEDAGISLRTSQMDVSQLKITARFVRMQAGSNAHCGDAIHTNFCGTLRTWHKVTSGDRTTNPFFRLCVIPVNPHHV